MCWLFISSFPASEASPSLAGCLCGINWDLQFLGWLGLLYSGSSATGSGSLWNGWWKYEEVSAYFSSMPWKKVPGLLLCWWLSTLLGNLESIVNSPQKLVLNSFFLLVASVACSSSFFFLWRSPINILCRRAWLILHSGGYMSKPHLDSWVKYTGQRNLWGPEKLACRMKRSHHSLFYSTPNTYFSLTLPTASGMPTLSCHTMESHVFRQRGLNSA